MVAIAASSSGASFFAQTRVTGDEAQGTIDSTFTAVKMGAKF